ncbi:MAG TPA: VCBS repeat-containing protein [Sandaracinaceae bacterium LLY-WYZ-13_1]|nr:VCBS repeat-containing protein [Sandaracinaceae bacterium LLY-WYZ-13_1]
MRGWRGLLVAALLLSGCDDGGGEPGTDGGRAPQRDGGSSTGGTRNPVCEAGESAGEVQAPVFVRNLRGETSWYASPVVHDLDGDGSNELIAAYYSVFVFDAAGELLARAEGGEGRIYAPHVVTDLEGDGVTEIVYGNGHEVWAYEWRDGALSRKSGWPADTTTADNPPEVRGLAAADLDRDGLIEVVATTTQTASTEDGGAQVFVFEPDGRAREGWPRYDTEGDATRHGMGHHGFGCYGLNVGIGDIDDDDDLEILVTYDNHHIQAFDPDGRAIDASPWFTNRATEHAGERFTWGQFIRWADPAVEQAHYHDHEGEWPHPTTNEWLQWTASPPNVVDLDGDGRNEVLGVPNVEMNEPYETVAYAIMALEGAHGDGSRSARRLEGWETLPRGGAPIQVEGYYPPNGVPAPLTVDLQGDERPEVVVSLNDGSIHAFDAGAGELWRFDFTHGEPVMYASEVVAADLNRDGSPELVLSTYGAPDVADAGYLVVLGADGTLLHDVPLPDPGENGNGNGAPAAPGIGDLDGDGALEIFVQTFDHGMDVFTVPGSGGDCLLWPTARGGPLRMGQPNTAE